MRRHHCRPLSVIFSLLLLLLIRPSPSEGRNQPGPAVDRAEAEKWRQDLDYMAREMEARHKNLFHTMTRDQFEAAVRRLREQIPSLGRDGIIVEMARIVALVQDGHTNIAPTRDPKIGFRSLPIKLYLFRDGLFVRAAEHGSARLVGSRVVKIGGVNAEEAVSRTREIIGRDNDMDVAFHAPLLLVMPEVLHALGLSESAESARFVVERAGRRQTVALKPSGPVELLPSDTDLSWLPKEGWVDLRDRASAPTPLWLKDPRNEFWFEYLPGSRAVYAQINKVGNKDSESLADFSTRLFAFVDSHPVDKLILDLRLNRGGNGTLLRPLEIGLIRSKVNEPGRLFIIMGRSTWSASQFLLDHLEKYTSALFVGEPSGSRGNTYGDSRKITLPNSGITVRISVYYWQDWDPWDTRLWTAPSVTAELASEDYRANRDPALAAILGYAPRKPLDQVLADALKEGGVDLAVTRFRTFKADPVNRYAATEEALLIAGQRLLEEEKPEQALVLFTLDARENPLSFRAYYALGYAYYKTGNREQAVQNLEKALAMSPKNYEITELLREVRQP